MQLEVDRRDPERRDVRRVIGLALLIPGRDERDPATNAELGEHRADVRCGALRPEQDDLLHQFARTLTVRPTMSSM